MSKMKMVPAVALKPDGSSESIICTDSASIGDLDKNFRQIRLPSKTIVIPFDGDKFIEVPTYAQAKRKKIGYMRP